MRTYILNFVLLQEKFIPNTLSSMIIVIKQRSICSEINKLKMFCQIFNYEFLCNFLNKYIVIGMGACMSTSKKAKVKSKICHQNMQLSFSQAHHSFLKVDHFSFNNQNELESSFQQSYDSIHHNKPHSIQNHKRSLSMKNQQTMIYRQNFSPISQLDISSLEQAQSLVCITNSNKQIKKDIISFGIRQLASHLRSQAYSNNSIVSFVDSLSHPTESQISDTLRTLTELEMDRLNQLINNVQFICKNPIQQFVLKKQIGVGGECLVYQAGKKKGLKCQRSYAVKVFTENSSELIRKIKLQIAIMRLVKSTNVVNFQFAYSFREKHYIFMEQMVHGSLTNLLKKAKQNHYQKQSKSTTIISEKLIAYILKQILQGIQYMHRHGVVHRDIKSDNILLGQNGTVKIGDFDHATLAVQQYLNIEEPVGTPAWMAPQLIKKTGYNQLIDIWSLGIVAIQLCLGQPPYLRMNSIKSMYMTVTQQPPKLKGISVQFNNFISQCLQKNPIERSSAQNLLKHLFLKNAQYGSKQNQQLNLIFSCSDRSIFRLNSA